jgi:cytochrome c oxidase assembly protein subunit 15
MTIAAFAIRKNNRGVFSICLSSLVLVVLQAWIGSWVVSTNLTSWVITVHMFLALVIIGLVVLAYQNVKFKNLPDLKLSAKKLRTAELFTWLSLALCTTQIIFGTELRESVDQQATFWNQSNRASWVALSGEVFNIHKGFSLLLTLATIICSGYILEHFKEIKRLISYVIVIITIMALQIITGIVLAYFNLPPAMQTLHLFFASLLIGAWVLQLALLANYRKSISMAIII